MAADLERRFGGIARLYGAPGARKIQGSHVCVVGIGGVGSWAAEALARSAVGALTLIDLDMVAESNTNRQIHALGDCFGRAKVDAMAERILAINPSCRVTRIEAFIDQDNAATLLQGRFDAVIDAIDQVKAKAAMIAHCLGTGTPIVVAGAAGGQYDPSKITVGDLAQTTQDPLLARVRSLLRREYGFPRDTKKKFRVPAVYSTEQLRYPEAACASPSGLSCAGFGSSVCVTSVFGMVAAAHVLNSLAKE